ncbi:TetR/AcrR family transcriptional regulator [Dokdonella sp.]|uniref:TetR/AcrR family transcriptional regulator n=1 Tax=Dokdonella sp. TaxID=2291710 RepID=UPI0031CBB42D|nr:TetR/AcrR family transcriptional regulator [Dokdonella sp.]
MSPAPVKTCGPGRPKDPEKRAAILDAAKRLFPQWGFEGTSMDAIASEAGVSKLTVYSHFTDKETLFFCAIRARCEEQMPETLFDVDRQLPLRDQLAAIGHAFIALVSTPEALSLHRLLVSGTGMPQKLVDLFLEAGPERVRSGFEQYLSRHIAAGRFEIGDVARAAQQFFALLKGEWHARQLCGCSQPLDQRDIDAQVRASVDMFLRAYARDAPPA